MLIVKISLNSKNHIIIYVQDNQQYRTYATFLIFSGWKFISQFWTELGPRNQKLVHGTTNFLALKKHHLHPFGNLVIQHNNPVKLCYYSNHTHGYTHWSSCRTRLPINKIWGITTLFTNLFSFCFKRNNESRLSHSDWVKYRTLLLMICYYIWVK